MPIPSEKIRIRPTRMHGINHCISRGRSRGGFVLVAVLLLVALATVLIVTTSSISQIERKAVSNSAQEELARLNALFALNFALSQLQSAAGPDQRVTATADILNSNSVTPSPVFQPYWTGVWRTVNTNFTPAPWFRPQPLDVDTNGNAGTTTTALRPWSTGGGGTNANITWLVSGATNNSVVSPLSSTVTWTNSSVLLASNWGTNANNVLVPAVTLRNGTTNTGRYAYWVSDEGVKAKVSLQDTNMSTASISTMGAWIPGLLHYFAPSASRPSTVMTNLGISSVLTSDFRGNTNLAKLTSLAGLALITNSVPAFSNNMLAGDLTVWSIGVLSDVRRGGLKQDLTAAFESSTSSGGTNFTLLQARSGSGSGNDACCVYRATNVGIPATSAPSISLVWQTNATSTTFDGPRWVSFYSFYNLYKTVMTTNPVTGSPVSGAVPAGLGGAGNGGSNITVSGPNTVEARIANWYETNTVPNNTYQFTILPITPTQIADRIDSAISAYSYLGNVTNGTNVTPTTFYSFQVQYYPMIVIHNPYAVTLTFSNNITFAISKNVASPQISLTCGTNIVTNSPWFRVGNVTNINPVTLIETVTSTTNQTNAYSGTNLFPVSTNSTNTVTEFGLYQGGGYPMSQTITNVGSLLPGEIRVFTLGGGNTNVLSMAQGCAFPSLVSDSSSASLDASSVYKVPWQGTTNPLDLVSMSIPGNTAGIGYNAFRWYPNGSLNKWPGSTGNQGFGGATPIVLQPTSGSANMTWNNVSIGTMADNALTYRIVGTFERLKGIISDGDTNFINSSTRAPMMMGNSVALNAGRSGGSAAFSSISSYTTEVYARAGNQIIPFNGLLSNSVANGRLITFWGALGVGSTNGSYSNPSRLVLRDIPLAPMTSLGQFMHLEDWNFNRSYSTFSFPAMSVGGSFACPELCTNAATLNRNMVRTTAAATAGFNWMSYDHSFMANEALFDTYFFSTVPPTNGFRWDGTSGYGAFSNTSISAASIASNAPLPNTRHVFYRKNGTNPSVANLQDESVAAANLLLDGAFNVNSTSVAAWKALLSSLQGHTFHSYNYTTGSAQDYTPAAGAYPIPRFWSVSSSATPNVPWEGLRVLDDTQLTALATEIVRQVRLRGPFLGMGDFLNRRLGNSVSQMNTMGTLQAAIENTATNGSSSDVNWCIRNVFNQTVNAPNFLTNIVNNTAAGIPGYLMQQDIVQSFAPVMTARSDTFVIRIYGEAAKPSINALTPSSVTGQAWGEAVVQRLPDFYDQTDPALTATTTVPGVSRSFGDATRLRNSSGWVVNALNQNFGRRFKLISFRWLNQNEL